MSGRRPCGRRCHANASVDEGRQPCGCLSVEGMSAKFTGAVNNAIDRNRNLKNQDRFRLLSQNNEFLPAAFAERTILGPTEHPDPIRHIDATHDHDAPILGVVDFGSRTRSAALSAITYLLVTDTAGQLIRSLVLRFARTDSIEPHKLWHTNSVLAANARVSVLTASFNSSNGNQSSTRRGIRR